MSVKITIINQMLSEAVEIKSLAIKRPLDYNSRSWYGRVLLPFPADLPNTRRHTSKRDNHIRPIHWSAVCSSFNGPDTDTGWVCSINDLIWIPFAMDLTGKIVLITGEFLTYSQHSI